MSENIDNHKIKNIILNFVKNHKTEIFFYIIFLLSFPISDVLLPKYYGNIMEDISDTENVKENIKMIGYLLALNLFLENMTNQLDAIFKPKFKSYIRTQIVQNILDKFKECYKEQEVGGLIAKVIKISSTLNDLIHQLKDYIVPMILIFTFAFVYFLTINKTIGLLFLSGITIFFTFIYVFMQSCINLAEDMDNLSDGVHEEIGEVLENLTNIYASCTVVEEIERIENYQKKLDEAYANTIKCSSNFNTMFTFLYLGLFSSFIYYCYDLQKQKIIKVSDLLSIIIVSLFIISNLKSATSEIRDFIFNIGIVYKTQGYLDQLFQLYESSKSKNEGINISQGLIEVKNVYLTYPHSDKYIFQNLNVIINPGEKVAIVGKIGSGKSSFIKMLLKFNKYTKGDVFIDGQSIKEVDPDILRNQIMYIPQNPKPLSRTLYENIVYGLKGISKEQVQFLIDSFQIPQLFGSLTLDDHVGKAGEKLSGGQKQIIMLLKCFLKNSRIIILDEPSSAIDNNSKVNVIRIINKLIEDKTSLIITHDEELLKKINFTRTLNF